MFIHNHILHILSVCLLALSLIFRWHYRNYESIDYQTFLLPWYTQLKAAGGIGGIRESIGDYYIPYMLVMALITYLPGNPLFWIKTVSVLFDYIMAFAGVKVAEVILEDLSVRTDRTITIFDLGREDSHFCIVKFLVFWGILLSPMVVLNSAKWAQCDAIYTSFLLFSLYCLLKERYHSAVILWGGAFVFKLQAIFMLPVYVFLYLAKKRFSAAVFMNALIMYFLAGLPAVVLGRSPVSVYKTYINQVTSYQSLTLFMPNVYYFLPSDYEEFFIPGILFTILLIMLMAGLFLYYRSELDLYTITRLAFWFNFTCIMFFPAMHERYGYVFVILSILLCWRDARMLLVSILLNCTTVMTYYRFFCGSSEVDLRILSAVNLIIWGWSGYQMIHKCIKDSTFRFIGQKT